MDIHWHFVVPDAADAPAAMRERLNAELRRYAEEGQAPADAVLMLDAGRFGYSDADLQGAVAASSAGSQQMDSLTRDVLQSGLGRRFGTPTMLVQAVRAFLRPRRRQVVIERAELLTAEAQSELRDVSGLGAERARLVLVSYGPEAERALSASLRSRFARVVFGGGGEPSAGAGAASPSLFLHPALRAADAEEEEEEAEELEQEQEQEPDGLQQL